MEFKGYMGLLLFFGLTNKNNISLHRLWNTSSIDHNDWASASMPRDRFIFINSKITFDDVDFRDVTSKNDPKFHKMREIFSIVKEHFRLEMEPGSNLCVDEQLYSFRGRCSFKQFMPLKPAR